MTDIRHQIVNDIVLELIALGNGLLRFLRADLDALGADLGSQTDNVLAFLSDQTGDITDAVSTSERLIKEAIVAARDFALRESSSSDQTIIDTLGGVIGENGASILAGVNQATELILRSQQATQQVLGGLEEKLSLDLGELPGVLGDLIEVLGDGIGVTIQNAINIDESIFGTVLETITEVLRESQEQNAAVLETILNVVSEVIADVIRTVGDTLLEQVPELRKIWQTIAKGDEELKEIAEKVLDKTRAGTGAATTRSTIEELTPGMERSAEQLQAAYVDFIGGAEKLACLTTEELTLLTTGPQLDGIPNLLFEAVAGLGAYLFLFLGIAQKGADEAIFRWMECNPVQPLPPAETVLAFQRGLIDAAKTESNLRKQGWSEEDASHIVNVGFTAPDLSLAYAMWLRDEIDDDAFQQLLSMLGYAESFHGALTELAFFIPPVQDLITMAVREVFTPEIAEAQGQFEDFPEDFADFAKKQGVSREWALNYWAAHWALPSVQMGFEMLHRGVIDKEQLDTLLRALDIMPGWREPLTQISFTPFTRVDIRRMHRLGVLSESEVLRAYKDIGYDDEKAAKQLEFVLAANQEDELITLDIASDLTRSSILNFYADGIIPRAAAFLLLTQAGINVAAAELFLLGADFDIERRERKQSVDLIMDRFRFGGQTETESADAIRGLGFETRERELAMLDLERLAQQETKLPSKADLNTFLEAGLIEPADYLDQLQRQGYSAFWAERYLALQLAAE